MHRGLGKSDLRGETSPHQRHPRVSKALGCALPSELKHTSVLVRVNYLLCENATFSAIDMSLSGSQTDTEHWRVFRRLHLLLFVPW
jgi:hypothetical protein